MDARPTAAAHTAAASSAARPDRQASWGGGADSDEEKYGGAAAAAAAPAAAAAADDDLDDTETLATTGEGSQTAASRVASCARSTLSASTPDAAGVMLRAVMTPSCVLVWCVCVCVFVAPGGMGATVILGGERKLKVDQVPFSIVCTLMVREERDST